ncbi:hypothetical protein NtB2_01607 [Lactococcus termiticola]|uniref:Uncharacterized protein n=1 Tax=Lactococcus termiticola TaxID=2169526 RepID=A0A2R5HL21_9LACT|nr:hypothetical protein NtB2_01607 [Lactococcus termiticola]
MKKCHKFTTFFFSFPLIKLIKSLKIRVFIEKLFRTPLYFNFTIFQKNDSIHSFNTKKMMCNKENRLILETFKEEIMN